MTRINILKVLSTISIFLVLLVFIGFSSTRLLSSRKQLFVQGAASSEIAYSSAILGGFKGLIADILWLRITALQTDHKLLELMELSELVTKLEPHIAEVWTFHAWNLSYNISLLADSKEDKWNWVKQGIELLRDKGLEINPGDPILALELAWIFQHKIGTDGADKYGEFYRTEWVKDISSYLGENGSIPEADSLVAVELEQGFKLSPSIMAEIENQFGKIDWRCPHAHALYWGWIAHKSNNKNTKLRSIRMVYSSAVKLSLDQGRIIGDPLADDWKYQAAPNHNLIVATHNFIRECLTSFDSPGIKNMFVGFTWTACNILYRLNNVELADEIYKSFCSSFIGYNFPELNTFIQGSDEVNAIGYAIDQNLIKLNFQ